MDKQAILNFMRWLDTASDEAIEEHRLYIISKSKNVGRDGRADVNLALRLLDEEVIARLSLRRSSK